MYTSIYNQGPIFQCQGSKTTNLPNRFWRKKWIFKVSGFGCLSEVLPEAREDGFGMLLGAFLGVFYAIG